MFNSKTKTDEAPMTASVNSSPAAASTPSYSTGASSQILNVIGAGTSVEGVINCDGDIRIEGHVKGTVNCKSKIVIGATGSVEGDMYCENADVSGKIFGSVEAKELLFLKASAYLEGDIATTKFVVETGAKFNGNCRMGVKEIKPNEKPASATITRQKEAVG